MMKKKRYQLGQEERKVQDRLARIRKFHLRDQLIVIMTMKYQGLILFQFQIQILLLKAELIEFK